MVSIDKLISDTSSLNPSKIAIKHGDSTFTYKEVNETSNQLARYFKDKNICQGDIVAISIDRSIEMVISLLAIIKTGAVYLPIDNNLPLERIRYMLNDANAKALVTARKQEEHYKDSSDVIFIEDAWQGCSELDRSDMNAGINEDSVAYILYTSGSTGAPKGVEVKHLGLTNLLLSVRKAPGMTANDIILNTTTISFDIAELEVFLPLICGALLLIADREAVKDGRTLLEIARKENVTIMQGTPFMWRTMMEAGWEEPLKIKIFCGGEALPKELAQKLAPRCKELWNMYGPTETTVYSIIKKIRADDEIIAIGHPIDNTRVYILDEQLNKVAQGDAGEIFIAGDGVGKGYLNRPELTAEKFIDDKFFPGGGKMYRTGDLGRVLVNGDIQCLGRIDHQIKIRGYRIESEEVEHQLKHLKNIKNGLVTLYTDKLGNTHLVAYVVPVYPIKNSDLNDCIKNWKAALNRKLPEYMVPDLFTLIDAIPLMPNGKVDRKSLPEPVIRQYIGSEFEGPQTDTERILSEICHKAIAVKKISVTDNLFELGIDSLIAVSIMVQVEKIFGKRLPLSTLMKYPTIRQLALAIVNRAEDSPYKALIPIKPHGSKTPLYIVHGIGLNLLNVYNMVYSLDTEQPVYGLQAIGLDGTMETPDTIEEVAHFYNTEIMQHDPVGPYTIAGYSFGGYIAYEMVKQLKEIGKEVTALIMFDTNVQVPSHQFPLSQKLKTKFFRQFRKAAYRINTIFSQPVELFAYLRSHHTKKFKLLLKRLGAFEDYHPDSLPPFMQVISERLENAFFKYKIKPFHVKIDLFKAEIRMFYIDDPEFLGWGRYAQDGVVAHKVPGDHKVLFNDKNSKDLAEILQKVLDGTE